jgi:hypothetical protein
MNKSNLNYTGQKFNRLTLIRFSHKVKNTIHWAVKCDCGEEFTTSIYRILDGACKSCGCYASEVKSKTHKVHGEGHKRTTEYTSWAQMKARCYNPKNTAFKDYGGRGILVCEKWKNSYVDFINDMGRSPSPLHSIERRDNSKGYYPENCYWATRSEQCNNRRSNRRITLNGVTKNLSQWCEQFGLHYKLTHKRIVYLGWSIERALTTQS